MKIRNQEILNFLSIKFGEKHLPIRVAYAIAVNVEEAAKKIKAYDELRIKLLEKYAEKDEEGKAIIEDDQYKVTDMEKFNEEFTELKETEVDMNVTTVSLDDLAKCDNPEFDSLTVPEISILSFMIEGK